MSFHKAHQKTEAGNDGNPASRFLPGSREKKRRVKTTVERAVQGHQAALSPAVHHGGVTDPRTQSPDQSVPHAFDLLAMRVTFSTLKSQPPSAMVTYHWEHIDNLLILFFVFPFRPSLIMNVQIRIQDRRVGTK